VSTVDALQAALAGEHACVFGYGLVGAHAADRDTELARTAFEVHRARRELLAHQLRLRDVTPVAAAPTYDLPFAVDGPDSARELAVHLESRLAAIYADLVGITSLSGLRRLAATALAETGELAASWAGDTPALPGIG
jgi:hypothetical protein